MFYISEKSLVHSCLDLFLNIMVNCFKVIYSRDVLKKKQEVAQVSNVGVQTFQNLLLCLHKLCLYILLHRFQMKTNKLALKDLTLSLSLLLFYVVIIISVVILELHCFPVVVCAREERV